MKRRPPQPRPAEPPRSRDRQRSELRASDGDRERVLEALRVAAGEGRLDTDEHERRADAALGATTLGELEPLTRDLPRRRGGRPSTSARVRRLVTVAAASGYLAVGVLLVGIWALTGGGYFWPVWPLLGWGVPLAAGALYPGRRGCAAGHGRPRDRLV